MSLITWRDDFSLGVESVDVEHREMIALINALDESMQQDASQDTVVETLGEIYARIASHFALEEKIMRNAGYEHLAAHKADHERLLDRLLDVVDSVDAEGRYERATLSDYLEGWFSVHFRVHDARLHNKLG